MPKVSLKNTLGIITMGVYKTPEFMVQFLHKPLVVWANNSSMFYISELADYQITQYTACEGPFFVFKGKNNEICEFSSMDGFGFKIFGRSRKFWVDKFNESEMAIIVYKGES